MSATCFMASSWSGAGNAAARRRRNSLSRSPLLASGSLIVAIAHVPRRPFPYYYIRVIDVKGETKGSRTGERQKGQEGETKGSGTNGAKISVSGRLSTSYIEKRRFF